MKSLHESVGFFCEYLVLSLLRKPNIHKKSFQSKIEKAFHFHYGAQSGKTKSIGQGHKKKPKTIIVSVLGFFIAVKIAFYLNNGAYFSLLSYIIQIKMALKTPAIGKPLVS